MAHLFALSIERDRGDRSAPEATEALASAWSEPGLLERLVAEGRVREALLLRTCCRTEIYGVAAEGAPLPPPELADAAPGGTSAPRLFEGDRAVLRLLRVLLGLESLAPGEEHVARQVKDAYARSVACGKILHRLFQRAFGVAAALRGAWGPGRPPSIPGLMAKRWLRSLPGSREGARADRDRPPEEIGASRERDLSALVVGAGAMAEATLAVLGACRVERTLTARRIERARALAEARGDDPDREIRLLPWERFRSALGAFDAVFLCTGSEEPLLGEADLEGILPSGRTPTICDLGQPPQVAREARGRLPYLSLDDLSREAAAASTAHAKALERLSEEAERAAEALYSEVLRRADDAWRRIALARASAVARERAEAEARRAGVPPELLERFAESVLSAYLRPLVTAPAPHSERAFRILAGVTGALAGEPLPPGRQGGE